MLIQIAIDGPGGSGKSTLAKALARELDYLYVNTGLIFRGLAWYMLNHPGENSNEILASITKHKNFIFDKNKWIFNNQEIDGKELISQQVTNKAAEIASKREIRNYVLMIEKDLATKNNVIMDGRDIGTKVFPNAILKIFLTTSEETRSERRYKELLEKNLLNGRTKEDISKELLERDKKDTEREIDPLVKAKDAIEINGDNKTVEELTGMVKLLFQKKLSLKKN